MTQFMGMKQDIWTIAGDLEAVKNYLKLEGYTELKVIKEAE